MKIDQLRLRHFRNIEELQLDPCEGVNIIYGENAQGKTNIIEALWMFSGMKSFRGAKDSELVMFGQERARLQLRFRNDVRDYQAQLDITNRRYARLNGIAQPSAAALIAQVPVVVFAPTFLSIVQSGPAQRRRFMDTAICQLSPAYTKTLTEFNRLLRQRNALLKDLRRDESLLSLLDVLDESFAAAAEATAKERVKFLLRLTPAATKVYEGISAGKERLSFRYLSRREESGGSYLALLRGHRQEDIYARTTCVGPHRDDLEICINGVSARLYGSQGQQRSCALAMKLAEANVLEESRTHAPVILLDDVMSELDAERQDYILNHITDRQVFITCCDPSNVTRLIKGKTVEIRAGRLITEDAAGQTGPAEEPCI